MLPTTYKVIEIQKGTLSVMAKPVPGEWIEDEFRGLNQLGIDKVVSLLEGHEQIEVGLEKEEDLCRNNNIDYASFPIRDRGVPNTPAAIAFSKALYAEICLGRHIVIHCRAGIGRTGIIAGAVLLMSGKTADEAFALISEARGVQVPDTDEQVSWLASIQSHESRG